jgi:hypothetical protein
MTPSRSFPLIDHALENYPTASTVLPQLEGGGGDNGDDDRDQDKRYFNLKFINVDSEHAAHASKKIRR